MKQWVKDGVAEVARQLADEEPSRVGPGGEYPFVLPVVIYNGGQRWTAATDIGDLLAPVPDELLGYLPRHRGLDHSLGGGAIRQERRGDATPTQERGSTRIDDVIRESPAMARGAGPGMSADAIGGAFNVKSGLEHSESPG